MPDTVTSLASNLVTSEAELEAIYGQPSGPAVIKEIDHISEHYRRFIELSPFVVLATVGPEGLDCTPRGDPPGFVRVVDGRTVMLPDRRGNNRIDSLRNIVRDPRVALLFLIPGEGRTLRINGRAAISIDPGLCASFEMEGKLPRSVLVVTADRVYTQCPKALVRSRLWDASLHVDKTALPSSGTIMKSLLEGFDGDTYDRNYPQHLKATIY
ncbi:MAG: pyridoxamine 5'-phosphate oxidase family protein [Alphaproteobacteria bacterium]|nr:pyridoxamine 5'-phosphate oxidase family protein [Alphaproteobacteria bacterium]